MLVYLVTVTGVPVYNHYCGGELEEVSLLLKSNDCCGEDEEEDAGCCSDEDFYIRNAPDFVSTSAKFKVLPASLLLALMPSIVSNQMIPGGVAAAPVSFGSDAPALQHDLVTVSVMRI